MDDDEKMFEGEGPRVYSVSGLTAEIRSVLESRFRFVWVEGEISNVRTPVSGHCYMALKDESAQIRAVMFRPRARILKFRPEDGMKVIAQGRVGVYEPRGEYQLVLDYLEPLGVGALALAFEQLKKKLAERGLFRQEIKRALPFLPGRIAVITSPTGAAVRDFLSVIHRRFANMNIVIVPVRVQGEGASAEIVRAIETVNAGLGVDVIVLTRGGGSLEDLWPFNEEAVALAIRASKIPIVSAVGHEIDITISDLAADLRAPTPSAAAELLVSEKESFSRRLEDLRGRVIANIRRSLLDGSRGLAHLRARLRDPRKSIENGWQRLDDLTGRIQRAETAVIRNKAERLSSAGNLLKRASPAARIPSLHKKLDYTRDRMILAVNAVLSSRLHSVSLIRGKLGGLNPHAVLKRGYCISRGIPDGRILKSAAETETGKSIRVTLWKGEVVCRVEEVDSTGNRS